MTKLRVEKAHVCLLCFFFFTSLLDGTTRNTTSFSSHGNASNGTKAAQHDTYAPWHPSSWNDATNEPGKTVRLRCKGFACFFLLSCWYWEAIKDESRYRHQELKCSFHLVLGILFILKQNPYTFCPLGAQRIAQNTYENWKNQRKKNKKFFLRIDVFPLVKDEIFAEVWSCLQH